MRPSMQQPLTNKKRMQNRGFTLIELMIALLIFSIIGGVLASIFVSGIIFYGSENSQVENQEAINRVSVSLDKDIRQTSNLSQNNGCLAFSQSDGIVMYCYDSVDKAIKRNTVITARNIELFTFLINNSQLTVTIRSIADRRGETNSATFRYYLREGNY